MEYSTKHATTQDGFSTTNASLPNNNTYFHKKKVSLTNA